MGDGFATATPATTVLHLSERVCVAPCGEVNVRTTPFAGHGGWVATTGKVAFPDPLTDGYDALPVGYPALLKKIANGGDPYVASLTVALLEAIIIFVAVTVFGAFGRPE